MLGGPDGTHTGFAENMCFGHLQICKSLFAPDFFEQRTLQSLLKNWA